MNENYITLNTGARMPFIGLGTYKAEPEKVGSAVINALMCGYRHLDCAAIYENEKEIGQALEKIFQEGQLKRSDIFITSKLWNTEHAHEDVRRACEKTLSDLKLEYLDLYLMHWGIAIPPSSSTSPRGRLTEELDNDGFLTLRKIPVRETWEAMEELMEAGLVKAIGIANFTAPMLIDLLAYAKIRPAVNQIELHPYLQQSALLDFCKHNNINVTAHSLLGAPGNLKNKDLPKLIDDSIIVNIAHRYNKSPAQVLIRWAVQRGTIAIPKSTTPERIQENIDIFDFELSTSDLERIAQLNKNFRYVDLTAKWKIPYFN